MPLISVIVPVYKVEKYLHRCVDSILTQTFTDFELILVDDGSPDNSGTICDEYVGEDSRVKVIHKENGGVSSARNAGLDVVTGEFVVFVDSDDTVDSCYLERLYQGGQYDFVTAGFCMQAPDDSWQDMTFPDDDTATEHITGFPSMYMGKYYFGAPWAKLFRKNILDALSLRFLQDVHNGEDTIFIFQFLKHTHRMKIVPTCGYHYHYYSNSLAHKKENRDYKWRIQLEQQVMSFFKPCDTAEEEWLNDRLFHVLMQQVEEYSEVLEMDQVYKFYESPLFESCIINKRKTGKLMERIFMFSMDNKVYQVYQFVDQVAYFCFRVKRKLKRIFLK